MLVEYADDAEHDFSEAHDEIEYDGTDEYVVLLWYDEDDDELVARE